MNLKGKTAIVTGGGRDIGRACAMRLSAAGANVAINYYKSESGALSAVAEIQAAGNHAFAMQGDMTKPAEVKAFVERAAEFGPIHVVVPVTGGILARKTIPEMTVEHWQAVMDVNVTSALLLVQAALPHMTEGGAIVNMASQAGRDGGGGGALAYASAKGAIMTMTRGMAKELAPRNIRVNALCPGLIDTDFHNLFTRPEVRKMVAGNTPLKREGTSDEVAELAVFLASDAASFINGANIDINGGILFS